MDKLEALRILVKVADMLRDIDPEMPMQTFRSFLEIALRPGCAVGDIGEALSIASSTASRNVSSLAAWKKYKVAGHLLVETFENPERRQQKNIYLTPKGQKLVADLAKALGAAK